MDGVMTGPRKMVSVGREGVGVSESSDGSPSGSSSGNKKTDADQNGPAVTL